MSIIEYIGSIGGIVGVFGYLIFLAYKATVKQLRDDRKFMEDRLTKLIENDHQTREAHTKALTEMTTLLIRLNGRLK